MEESKNCRLGKGYHFTKRQYLDRTKFKGFADDKVSVGQFVISVFYRIENIVRKGEMLVTSIFSFSHNVFKRLLSKGVKKSGLCGKEFTLS